MDQSDKATIRGRARGETYTDNCSLFGPQRICREFREKMNADDDDGTEEFARAQTEEVTISFSPLPPSTKVISRSFEFRSFKLLSTAERTV